MIFFIIVPLISVLTHSKLLYNEVNMKIIIALILAVITVTNLHESYQFICIATLAAISIVTVYLYFGKSKEHAIIDCMLISLICFMALTALSSVISQLPIEKQVTVIMSIYVSFQLLDILNYSRNRHGN